MTLLRSYVRGGWHTAADEGRPLFDAVTGAEVARISSAGVDFAGALEHGRRVGGPALRELTFHQRGALLKALAGHLREHREELYAISAMTGATRGDSRFDIDGGLGTLLGFASKARREMPNDTVYVEGDVEPLGKGGTFVGQHVCVPLRGVAVQVNAFNFPVWGPLEKFAPAFLAGVPSVVKPASPTAFLTARLVELIVASGLLPEGVLQFVAGSVGDTFDHLTEQDLVSFTGSAATAATLRTHPVIVRRAVRFTAEADSLNCSILGPDAAPGTPEFDLYVTSLVTEMTVKAGQKCTAIRRALVPERHLDAVAEAVSARLAAITVGNPAAEGVSMGALASLEQRVEVRRSVKALADAGRIVFGDPERVEVVDADAERGAFVSPILLTADPDRAAPHEVEAFGPVSTVLPYTSTDQAIALAARGQGSLVGSVVTADTAFAREVVLGLAPWHGRLLVLNSRDGAESTGHGSPLPALVHGGPGRAGGGEELGGIRGVLHHMQRTAVQADPDTLTAITGRWVAGSARTVTDVHPFRKHLEELRIGDTITAGPRTVTQQDVEHFAEFTGDTFYAHMDEAAAARNPFFGQRVAHGYLVVSLAAGLFVDPHPGPVLANFGVDRLRFLSPTTFGDELSVTLTVKQVTPRDSADYGEVRWDADVTRGDGESVARYDVLTLVAKQPDGGEPVTRLQGRVALVTGGARGIGAATAQRLAAEGAAVALVDLDEAAATQTATELTERTGRRAIGLAADVTDAAQITAAVDRTAEELGSLDILVNNAGVTRDNLLFRMTEDDWDTVIGVHLRGAFLATKAAQRHMVARRWGRIISLSSVSALGNRGQVNYSAAKAGLQGATRTLAIELGPFGITANAVAPGFVVTEMTAQLAERLGSTLEQFTEERAAVTPVRRAGQPADIAAVIAFLAGEEASFITGQTIYVDGGRRL